MSHAVSHFAISKSFRCWHLLHKNSSLQVTKLRRYAALTFVDTLYVCEVSGTSKAIESHLQNSRIDMIDISYKN